MQNIYLTVRSVTPGQKGREALERAGIRCRLRRAPGAIAPGGCAYALVLPAEAEPEALEIRERAGVRVEGRYLRDPEGSFRRLGS